MRWDRFTEQAMPSTEVTHLHLLRHGAPETGGRRLCYGHLDLGLSPHGLAQHAALVRLVADHLPKPDGILSSDLGRAAQLARALGEALGLPVILDPALREQHMGDWEGRPWEALTAEDVEGVRAFWSDYAGARPPGGESLGDLAARVRGALDARWAQLRGGRWVVVGHVGVLRAILCGALGLPLDQALRFAPAPGTHTWLSVASAGAVVMALGERPLADDPGVSGAARPAAGAGARRLALSGSAGTGKTTLARALADHLELPYIPEGMRERIEAGFNPHDAGPDGLRALISELWEEQAAREDAAVRDHGGFVADRSAVDFAAFWLHYGFAWDAAATRAFFARTLQASDRYDRVLVLPWGALPLVADGVRTPNPYLQRQFQATLEGLLARELPAERVGWVPPLDGVGARLAWVEDLLRGAGGARG